MKTTRRTQIWLLALLAVCFAQVGWWFLDQVRYTGHVQSRLHELYGSDLEAAQELAARGLEAQEIERLYPHLRAQGDGFALSPATRQALRRERFSHLNRYGWEGAFFLVVLGAVMLVIGRLLRHDAELRRRQENFLALVSHELKSPLASLKLSLDTLALRDPEAGSRRQLLERMKVDFERWQNMISNLLDTSVLEKGNLALEKAPVSLGQVARVTIEELRPTAEEANVDFELRSEGDAVLVGDRRAVQVVIRNLLDNGIKATAVQGGGEVSVRLAQNAGAATLEVLDNGLGFEPAESERLFEKFYRPGDEMRPKVRGPGLGLYLVRRLVELGGGEVSAHSEGPGRGASFQVTWPSWDEAEP